VNTKGVVAVSARNHAQGVLLTALLKGEKEIKGSNCVLVISEGIPVGCSKIVLELETTGFDHIQEILETLREEEYAVEKT
jgi:hypothetical protein